MQIVKSALKNGVIQTSRLVSANLGATFATVHAEAKQHVQNMDQATK
jgi:hypothetical protein